MAEARATVVEDKKDATGDDGLSGCSNKNAEGWTYGRTVETKNEAIVENTQEAQIEAELLTIDPIHEKVNEEETRMGDEGENKKGEPPARDDEEDFPSITDEEDLQTTTDNTPIIVYDHVIKRSIEEIELLEKRKTRAEMMRALHRIETKHWRQLKQQQPKPEFETAFGGTGSEEALRQLSSPQKGGRSAKKQGRRIFYYAGNVKIEQTTCVPTEADGKTPHGHGMMKYNDGAIYVGDWKDGKRCGQGVETMPDGCCYHGFWKDDQRCGLGVEDMPDGTSYYGEWKDNKRNGYGTLSQGPISVTKKARTKTRKIICEGQWKNGFQHGQGSRTWLEEAGGLELTYVGEWEEGKRQGLGRLTASDGSQYEGEYKDDQANGWGTKTWSGGRRYDGEFKNNKPDGKGIMMEPGHRKDWILCEDGETCETKYHGEWKDGGRHGFGTMTWHYGVKYSQYTGEWKDGHFDGQGFFTALDGCQYEYQDGQRKAVGRQLHSTTEEDMEQAEFLVRCFHQHERVAI